MMSLLAKQIEFTRCVGKLIAYAESIGCELTFGDAYRDPRLHGEFGKPGGYGALKSCHKLRLAVDFNLFFGGHYVRSGQHEAYKMLGEHWESMHPNARWGGRFDDANHFSFTHYGAK